MAYIISNGIAGVQPIATTSTVQNHPLGKIVHAIDPAIGEGEFIYLKGVSSTVVGSWVRYNYETGVTTLLVPDIIGPVAVAMSANNSTSNYGWYQISGLATALAADVSDSGLVYIDTAAGTCDDAVVAGDKVHNATWASDDSTASGTATVSIARPFCTDEST
jgi:hypothetical protein